VTRKERPLRAFVSQGVLVIEVGIDTLAWAALHTDYVLSSDPGARDHTERFHINDTRAFAKDVVSAMTDEAEDGSSRLTRFIDDACVQSIDQGSIAFVDKEDK
jgi:hypothetical protein